MQEYEEKGKPERGLSFSNNLSEKYKRDFPKERGRFTNSEANERFRALYN